MKRMISAAAALVLAISASFATSADVAEHQWVRASKTGEIEGRAIVPRKNGISAVRDARVILTDRNGVRVVSGVKSDKTGRFTLRGVEPGVYSLMIDGNNAFAVSALHVVRPDVQISSKFEIAAGAVDYRTVRSAMIRYLPSKFDTAIKFDPSKNPFTSGRTLSGEVVRFRQHNGGLKGRLTRAGATENLGAKNATVLVYSDGVEVARTTTDENGNFMVAELAPGSYSILGSSKDGFGLMGIELVDPLTIKRAAKSTSGTKLVAQAEDFAETFVMQVAPGPISVLEGGVATSDDDDGGAVPFDGGSSYAGGGGGGAGGGIGGGGGAGTMAALGLGVAGLAVAVSDDDNITPPPPASPVAPAPVSP